MTILLTVDVKQQHNNIYISWDEAQNCFYPKGVNTKDTQSTQLSVQNLCS